LTPSMMVTTSPDYSRVALRSTQIVFGKEVTAILPKTPRIEA
jgi:hypothetical protein